MALINPIRKLSSVLASARLAMALLIAILVSCVIGVTVLREERAWSLIFSALWFNGLLVLLVVNVGFCFFGRIWGRKLTLTSLGMILFHLSFVAILGGVVYNSLFYFRGLIRLTEGETLPSGDPQSYDYFDHGRFFSFSKLRGETTLIKMHAAYQVDGLDKRAAYEIAVGEGRPQKHGIIYITHNLSHNGFTYLPEKEGYSLLILLSDGQGRELYGAHVPLQSLKQKDDTFLYTTGTKYAPGSFPFPQNPLEPLFGLQAVYHPQGEKRPEGEAFFQVWKLHDPGAPGSEKAIVGARAAVGERIKVGGYYLTAQEVRYWAGMNVRHEPGKPVVLFSLWAGLAGMVITFIGRIRKSGTRGV